MTHDPEGLPAGVLLLSEWPGARGEAGVQSSRGNITSFLRVNVAAASLNMCTTVVHEQGGTKEPRQPSTNQGGSSSAGTNSKTWGRMSPSKSGLSAHNTALKEVRALRPGVRVSVPRPGEGGGTVTGREDLSVLFTSDPPVLRQATLPSRGNPFCVHTTLKDQSKGSCSLLFWLCSPRSINALSVQGKVFVVFWLCSTRSINALPLQGKVFVVFSKIH
uniref:Uncharacterized protein n=1 Tax=Timema tahoe TaxID=61484 RepID=A0A7R9IIX1_9NEOP|nr:unnamed protein product [Timema tahoe]